MAMLCTLESKTDVMSLLCVSETLFSGCSTKIFTYFLLLRASIAAAPVSPEVAVIKFILFLLFPSK